MKTFICKQGEQNQEYKDFIIVTSEWDKRCFIFEEIAPNKFKKRREVMGANTSKCDQYGNKLFKRPESLQQLVDKAKAFIDNHIVKWADSPNNRINQKIK